MMIKSCVANPTSPRLRSDRRRGTIVSLLAFSLIGLLGFLALSIDIGMLAVAKGQIQNAADLASLTACRTLNGNSSVSTYNNAAATTNAQNVLGYNNILGQTIASTQLTLTYGSYDYSQSAQSFSANYPPTTGVPWTAVKAQVSSSSTLPAQFSRVFGNQFLPSVTATAQAVHRPRDIAMVMDLSASMRFGTLLGYDFYTSTRVTNNPDTNVPAFGHYATNSSSLIGPSTNSTSAIDSYTIPPTNTTLANSSYSLTYINSFYQNAAYASTLVRAFDSYTSSDNGTTWKAPTGTPTPSLPSGTTYASVPGGDVPLFQSGSTTTYAQTLDQVLGNSSSSTGASGSGFNILWELDGYSSYAGGKPDTSGSNSTPQVWAQADYSAPATPPTNGSLPFNGYTQGPGYWGKTFFLWPPDPRNNQGTVGGVTLSGATLQNYLAALGIASVKKGTQSQADTVTLANAWSTWQGNGSSGLTYLQTWLNTAAATSGTVTINGVAYNKPGYNYGTGASPLVYVPTTSGNGTTQATGYWSGSWNGTAVGAAHMPSTYYAVCRFFNRSYPSGAAWTSSSVSADWRLRFFGTTNDNTVIFNSNGSLNPPGTSGMWPSVSGTAAKTLATYNAILQWLNQSPNPFPAMMRAGRIKYYGSMPNGTSSTISGTWPSFGGTDQRFWVEVMDHMLGFIQTSSGSYMDLSGRSSGNSMTGYGADISWGTLAHNTVPSSTPQPYMDYRDNPARPLLRFWFSPILMVDYLHNCNMYEQGPGSYYLMQPADCYEAPLYVAKQAYVAAVNTMQNNHPNDWFAMMSYSWPRTSASSIGRQNCVGCPLGTNYAYATSSLLFPFSTIKADGTCNNTEVTPYDADAATGSIPSANFVDTPRSDGDTSFAMGLMLAYNQFAVTPTSDTNLRTFVSNSPITFPTGMAGGLGRKGAQKVIIFETDGIANCAATASLVTSGSGSSAYTYYKIRYDMNSPSTAEYPTINPTSIGDSSVTSQLYGTGSITAQLRTTYGTTRNPFRMYCIGFGPVFNGGLASTATSLLVNMQNEANQTSITSLPSNQVITGTDSQMSANMISAYTTILESGVQIALIQ